jgi:hypothetical protein
LRSHHQPINSIGGLVVKLAVAICSRSIRLAPGSSTFTNHHSIVIILTNTFKFPADALYLTYLFVPVLSLFDLPRKRRGRNHQQTSNYKTKNTPTRLFPSRFFRMTEPPSLCVVITSVPLSYQVNAAGEIFLIWSGMNATCVR